MEDVEHPQYRQTESRLHIITALSQARDNLEMAARAIERDGYPDDAHKTRNVAQSAQARRCLMEQQWSIKDAERKAARKGKAKK